ncbi:serine/threonine-protein kinase SRPK3 [Seiridium cupressi]
MPTAARCELQKIQYISLEDEDVEDVQRYNRGGFHPVHIDDVLDGRFEVLHKLGSGGFGTVWFCWDNANNKPRALKVMAADHSATGKEEKVLQHLKCGTSIQELEENNISVPLDQFWIEGSNGKHLCYVLPIMRVPVDKWRLSQSYRDAQAMTTVKHVCFQIARALQYLQRRGVCHGDFRPANILMKLKGLDGLTKEQIVEMLGDQDAISVETVSGDDPKPHGPEYCVVPVSRRWCETLLIPEIAIIDFGESFLVDQPERSSGIPISFAAPEIIFRNTLVPGFAMDIWSLACTIYEINNNRTLFAESPRMVVRRIEYMLGPLPSPYRAVWHFYKTPDGEQPKTEPADTLSLPVTWSVDDLQRMRETWYTSSGYRGFFETELAKRHKFLSTNIPGQGITDIESNKVPSSSEDLTEQQHIFAMADLLKGMLKYNPDERIDIDQVVRHKWFGNKETSLLTRGLGRARSVAASHNYMMADCDASSCY